MLARFLDVAGFRVEISRGSGVGSKAASKADDASSVLEVGVFEGCWSH